MPDAESLKFGGLLMLIVTMSHGGIAQRLQVDTKQLEPLIREWNYANNFRSSESFENVYSPNLLFYTQNLERSEAIALKRSLFRKNPQFRQRINTPITYTPYSSGVIRCDFTKEVFEGSGWKQYPSYLLFSYEGNRYRIVGESDNATDKTLRYRLNIGEPMDIGSSAGADSTANDSQLSLAVPERRPGTESEASLQPAGTDQPQSVSRDSITIPKIYVFIFLGILAAAGILLFIRRRPRKPIPTENYPMVPQNKAVEADDAYNVIREFNMQSVFEAFVITLFDPLYFRHKRPKAERVLAGKRSEGETLPDLEFEFNHRDTHVRLAIKCLYYKNAGTNEFQLFSSERQEAFRHFEDESGMPMYYIVGIGGTPDDPKEIYLVPAKAVAKEFVTRMELKPFGKSGMFFYSGTEGRLR